MANSFVETSKTSQVLFSSTIRKGSLFDRDPSRCVPRWLQSLLIYTAWFCSWLHKGKENDTAFCQQLIKRKVRRVCTPAGQFSEGSSCIWEGRRVNGKRQRHAAETSIGRFERHFQSMIPSNRSEHPKYLPLFREPTVTFVDMAAAYNGVLAAPPIANVVAAKLNPCSIDLIGCMDFFLKKVALAPVATTAEGPSLHDWR